MWNIYKVFSPAKEERQIIGTLDSSCKEDVVVDVIDAIREHYPNDYIRATTSDDFVIKTTPLNSHRDITNKMPEHEWTTKWYTDKNDSRITKEQWLDKYYS